MRPIAVSAIIAIVFALASQSTVVSQLAYRGQVVDQLHVGQPQVIHPTGQCCGPSAPTNAQQFYAPMSVRSAPAYPAYYVDAWGRRVFYSSYPVVVTNHRFDVAIPTPTIGHTSYPSAFAQPTQHVTRTVVATPYTIQPSTTETEVVEKSSEQIVQPTQEAPSSFTSQTIDPIVERVEEPDEPTSNASILTTTTESLRRDTIGFTETQLVEDFTKVEPVPPIRKNTETQTAAEPAEFLASDDDAFATDEIVATAEAVAEENAEFATTEFVDEVSETVESVELGDEDAFESNTESFTWGDEETETEVVDTVTQVDEEEVAATDYAPAPTRTREIPKREVPGRTAITQETRMPTPSVEKQASSKVTQVEKKKAIAAAAIPAASATKRASKSGWNWWMASPLALLPLGWLGWKATREKSVAETGGVHTTNKKNALPSLGKVDMQAEKTTKPRAEFSSQDVASNESAVAASTTVQGTPVTPVAAPQAPAARASVTTPPAATPAATPAAAVASATTVTPPATATPAAVAPARATPAATPITPATATVAPVIPQTVTPAATVASAAINQSPANQATATPPAAAAPVTATANPVSHQSATVAPQPGVQVDNKTGEMQSATNQVVSNTAGNADRDDFTILNHVGPETANAFHAAGYYRYADLEKADPTVIQRIMTETSSASDFQFDSWLKQVNCATRGDWNGLGQQILNESKSDLRASGIPTVSPATPKSTTNVVSNGTTTTGEANVQSAVVDGDDLTRIRGIGPATAELLNGFGIRRFEDLAARSEFELMEILNKGGARFQPIYPTTWATQATYASAGNWGKLAEFTTNEETELLNDANAMLSESEKSREQSGSVENELTRIRGIAPATAEALGTIGITSIADLAKADVSVVQSALDKFGTRFQNASPSEWLKQAQEITGQTSAV